MKIFENFWKFLLKFSLIIIFLITILNRNWIKYVRCVSATFPLNPIETWCTTPKFKYIFWPQSNPDAVGRWRPALHLRSFPIGYTPQTNLFFLSKLIIFFTFTKFIIFIVFTTIFWLKIYVFHVKHINLLKFENFWKFCDQNCFWKQILKN